MVDESSPAVEYIILELPLINVILDFSCDTLELSLLVHLAKTKSGIILTYSHVEINRIWIFALSFLDDLFSVDYPNLFPFV